MIVLWLFNLGYLCQHIGSIHQIYLMIKNQSADGVSIDTQILFLIGAISRAFWVQDTQLKNEWMTYFELALGIATIVTQIILIVFIFNKNFSIFKPIFQSTTRFYERWYFIVIITSVLSYFFFPGDEGQEWDIQMLVSLTIFTEAGGLIPQIPMLLREKEANSVSRIFLLFLSLARMLRLLFWLKLWSDGMDFLFLVVADVLHLFMVSSFIYSFVKSLNSYKLPQHESYKKLF